MNHETCRERLVDLAYGELSRREAAELERHLAECEPCRAERDRLAEALGAMRRLPAPPPPERDDALVMAAARQAAEDRRRDSFGRALRAFSVRIAAGTAFAALAVFLVVQVRQGLKSPAEYAAERASAPVASPGPVAPEAPTKGSPPLAVTEQKPEAAPAVRPPSFAERPPAAGARGGSEPRRDRAQAGAVVKKIAPSREERSEDLERRSTEAPLAAPAPSSALPKAKSAPSRPSPPAEAEAGATGDGRPSLAQGPAQNLGAAPPPSSAAERSRFAAAPSARGPSPGRASVAGLDEHVRFGAASSPATAWAREVERRRAAGELSEAQKRFDPCPGGDVRRVAWIDAAQRVLKLVRERADGAVVEEWFDEEGRLREAFVRARAGGGSWSRHVTLGERGEESSQDASDTGLAPESPPPPLVRRDPSGAFFSGPGCAR